MGERRAMDEERERLRLSAVVQNSRDFIGISDTAGVPIFVNDAGIALVGATGMDEIRRTAVPDYFVPEERQFVVNVVLAAVRAAGAWRGELRFRHFRTGEAIPVLYDVFRIDDPASGRPLYFGTVTKDIREQKGHEQAFRALAEELDRQRLLLKTVTDNASVALFITDEQQRCVFMNPAAEEMTAFPYAELEGRPLVDLILDASSGPGGGGPIDRAVQENLRQRGTAVFVRKGGARYDVAFTASPIREAARVRGTVLEAREITEEVQARRVLDQAQAERERLLAELERASAAKDECLAMLGHELRNPLAPIVSALELLKLRQGGGANREQLVIERHVAHLVRMVDDLLDISRITRGQLELRKEPVELSDVLAKAVEMASLLLEQRNHRLVVDVPAGLWTHGDPVRLAQAVANLLTNAARYTDPGGRIHLFVEQGEGELAIHVKDDGIGIAPDLLPRVFDLFVQGRRGARQAEGGLGIGLALVQNIVQRHGGTVAALSEGPGRGSEFIIRLAAAAAPAEQLAPPPAHRLATARPRRILLVDDNQDAAELLGEVLTGAGHDVRVATDPVAALSLAEGFGPEVAVLDIGLPVMDGYELAARLRGLPGLEDVALLALTGYGQDHDRARSGALGFLHHLVKPIRPSDLLALIEALP